MAAKIAQVDHIMVIGAHVVIDGPLIVPTNCGWHPARPAAADLRRGVGTAALFLTTTSERGMVEHSTVHRACPAKRTQL